MDFLSDFLGFIEATFLAIWRVCATLIYWSVEQIYSIPWNQLGYLPAWKIVVLSTIMAVWGVFVYRMFWAYYEAGEKVINAAVILTTVFIRSLPIIVAAGLVAAAGAWIINNVNY
jgi:hypothetical protein